LKIRGDSRRKRLCTSHRPRPCMNSFSAVLVQSRRTNGRTE
jgi:hypothetical protein